jgi:hypothetical protein
MKKTQSIKREQLADIYNNVCQDWQKEISKLVLFQSGVNIKVSEELILKGYKAANDDQKKLITKYFKIEENINILQKVKNFSDILKISGKTLKTLLPYQNPKNPTEIKTNAFIKIKLIEEVLNQGWIPNWENNYEYKYYPYFILKNKNWTPDSVYFFEVCSGAVGFYQNKEISDFVGKTFLKEYIEFLTGEL